MTIPTYRDIDLALLVELTRRSGAVRASEIYGDVARHFPDLTEEDLARTRQDGRTKIFKNMIHWARDHLRVRGLLVEAPPGRWQVNEDARRALIADLQERGITSDRGESFVGGRGSLGDLLGAD